MVDVFEEKRFITVMYRDIRRQVPGYSSIMYCSVIVKSPKPSSDGAGNGNGRRLQNTVGLVFPSTALLLLAELHADLFSRHASPLEVRVFVAVDLSPMQRKTSKEGGGRSVQLPDWVMNKTKRQHIICS